MKKLSPFRHAGIALLAGAGVALALPQSVLAVPPRVTVAANSDLRFGSFVVFTRGSRTVSATGAVTNSSIEPVGRDLTAPASFTVSYDRGNQNRKPISLVIQVQLMTPPSLSSNGLTGSLSSFSTDLTGFSSITPGQVMTITIDNCTTRICSRSFRIGARLDVLRTYGGGTVGIPLPVTAALVAVN